MRARLRHSSRGYQRNCKAKHNSNGSTFMRTNRVVAAVLVPAPGLSGTGRDAVSGTETTRASSDHLTYPYPCSAHEGYRDTGIVTPALPRHVACGLSSDGGSAPRVVTAAC